MSPWSHPINKMCALIKWIIQNVHINIAENWSFVTKIFNNKFVTILPPKSSDDQIVTKLRQHENLLSLFH